MIYRFEDVLFDIEHRELRRHGTLRSIEPQVFDLLIFLIQNRERVVSRDEIFKAVWHDRIVSDSVLSTRIHAARSAIGDNGVDQRLIRTLRTKGVRFVGGVQEEKRPERTNLVQEIHGQELSGLIVPERPTIAVLPFATMGGSLKQGDFANGLTEELIISLTKMAWLLVTSRNSSFAYKHKEITTTQAARELGVRYMVQGSVRYASGRVRIAVQLIDALADYQLWAERYDRDLENALAVQDEIADKVVTAIAPQVYFAEDIRIQRKVARDYNAWECMVRALALMNGREERRIMTAHNLLQQAVTLDPRSASACGLLSLVTTLGVHMGWARRLDAVPIALSIARRALSLNADEPWAHAALGYAKIWQQPADALPHLHRALSLNPNFAIGHYLLALASTYAGDFKNIFKHADMAERLAPRDLLARGYAGAHNNVRATASFAVEEYDQGIEFARRAIADSPRSPTAYRALLINLALGENVDEAKQALPKLKRIAPNISQAWIKETAVWGREADMKRYVEAFRVSGLK